MKQREIGILVALLIASVGMVSFYGGINYTDYYRDAELELEVESGYCAHITITVWRAATNETEVIKDGVLTNNAGTLTTIGKNWIEDQLGDSPSTDPAKWISLSLSSDSPAAGWTEIPAEIVAGGLTRAAGTYASTGDGVWTESYQFTASATHVDVQLTGLQYAVSGDNNLLGADTFTPVTLNSGDKLTTTWTITVT